MGCAGLRGYVSSCPEASHWVLPQVAALIARYLVGGGRLDKATLDLLASFHPAYLCSLSPEQLGDVQQDVVW